MKPRSMRLNVESLDGRIVPSTVDYGDFNHDGNMDMAAITSPTTITVSLGNGSGYTAAATLTAPNNKPITNVTVYDYNHDGDPDVVASGLTNNGGYTHVWLGNGDGTFASRKTTNWHWPTNGSHGSW
jgi:VCBS repeat protein